MAQTEFSEYRVSIEYRAFWRLAEYAVRIIPRMNPPQFFAEMKRPNVGVLLGAFATSGWLSLQAIAILWAALEAMACGIKQFVRTMALRKTHAPVIPESIEGARCKG